MILCLPPLDKMLGYIQGLSPKPRSARDERHDVVTDPSKSGSDAESLRQVFFRKDHVDATVGKRAGASLA